MGGKPKDNRIEFHGMDTQTPGENNSICILLHYFRPINMVWETALQVSAQKKLDLINLRNRKINNKKALQRNKFLGVYSLEFHILLFLLPLQSEHPKLWSSNRSHSNFWKKLNELLQGEYIIHTVWLCALFCFLLWSLQLYIEQVYFLNQTFSPQTTLA